MIHTYNELLKSFCWNSLRILVTVTQFLRRFEELLHPQFSKILSHYFNQAEVYSTFLNHHSFLLSCSVNKLTLDYCSTHFIVHTMLVRCLRGKLPFPSHELQTGIPFCKRKSNPIKYTLFSFIWCLFLFETHKLDLVHWDVYCVCKILDGSSHFHC